MNIGEINRLTIARETPNGLYLTDGREEVLLPNKQCPEEAMIGDQVSVFLYNDSEDRPIATMVTPKAKVGDFALLKVVSVTPNGAFLDWGLEKDLFCAIKEQLYPMEVGLEYLVRVYLDHVSQRVACSSRINRFLEQNARDLAQYQAVQVRVYEFAHDWTNVIVDGKFRGAIFADEWIEELAIGDVRTGYIKRIRPEDNRISISLRPQGYFAVLGEADKIVAALKANGGTLPISDKSSPEEIQKRFGLSKGAFKKLIGTLYREQIIEINENSIRLLRG